MRSFVVKPEYDIRWRFEYFDGTAPKWGQWTRPEHDIKNMVAFKRTENLARAFIERKNKRTFEIDRPIHCAGPDYVMFKWDCVGKMGISLKQNLSDAHELPTQVVGLILVTRELECLCRVDGSPPIIRVRSKKDKMFHYEGFGR